MSRVQVLIRLFPSAKPYRTGVLQPGLTPAVFWILLRAGSAASDRMLRLRP